MIEIRETTAWVLLGTGDVYFCIGKEEEGRSYVVLTQTDPGAIGHEDDVGRDSVVEDEFIPAKDPRSQVVIESTSVESLDQVILCLTEYRDKLEAKKSD